MSIQRLVQRLITLSLTLIGASVVILANDSPPSAPPAPAVRVAPMHPSFALLDAEGVNVLDSGKPASTFATCGTCHDTAFISANNAHHGVENVRRTYVGAPADAQTYVSAEQAETLEMNCFVCHTALADNASRTLALSAGNLAWSNSATLIGAGILTQHEDGSYTWNADAFNAEDKTVLAERIGIQDPTSANCGACHGAVHTNAQLPMALSATDVSNATTATTGQVMSPQRLSNSALNLADKASLSRSWDVHAERLLNCVDCHYSLNNPVFYREDAASQPAHLLFDPRRLDLGEYLHRPSHQLAKGAQARTVATPENTMRRCESCHSAATSHPWLPYNETHMASVACETCHIPQLYAPALERVDWTVLTSTGEPASAYRGLEGDLWTGYQPVILPRTNADGTRSLAPFNLISVWRWQDDAGTAVALSTLRQVYFTADSDAYRPEILALFDADLDGALSPAELVLDNDDKTAFIAQALSALGVQNPQVSAEVHPYTINHNVVGGDWAIKECQTCHNEDSRLAIAFPLSPNSPAGVQPVLTDTSVLAGSIVSADDGALSFSPAHQEVGIYVFGHDSVPLIDTLGMLLFLGTLGAVVLHGGLRVYLARKFAAQLSTQQHPEMRREYMYSVYERQWHWLQTAAIFLLIFSGMVVHKPAQFSAFSFPFMVDLHNILAVILVINAGLAAFYHVVSGEIQQFLPKPRGFFNDAFAQARYYAYGIFKGEPHPLEKSRERKMNPIQQVTYLMLLNVLLPAQIITGILMWGAKRFPDVTQALGGLPLLAPFHTLIAWLFATFIVVHVYMTTTGHTPLANIKAMMFGWDDLEVSTETHTSAQGAD